MKYPATKRLLKSMRRGALAVVFGSLASQAGLGQHVDWEILDQYCLDCHNLDDFAGGTAFDLLSRDNLTADADIWELTIRKVRTGMMPPSGHPRPSRAVLDDFTQGLANGLDEEYDSAPNPGNEGM